MIKKMVAVLTAAVLGILLTGGTAAAQEQQNFTVLGFASGTTVIATGAITAVGVEELIDEAVANGEFTTTRDFIFDNGTISIAAEGTIDETFNEFTCLGSFTATGTYEITDGSGDFVGATGEGTVAVNGTFLAGRDSDGGCSEEEEVFSYFSARLSGDIAFDEGGAP